MPSPMFLSLMFSAMTAGPASIPYAKTQVAELSTRALQHDEVLRIRRDFGKPDFEIVVDSWRRSEAPAELADVRMWWVQPDDDDVRSPFGQRVHKYVEFEYEPHSAGDWAVVLRADRKEFSFDVEVDAQGDAQAFADVQTTDGEVQHCRATSGRLVARRLLGIPLGIKRLELTCEDDDGQVHEGSVPYRKLRRGPVYRG